MSDHALPPSVEAVATGPNSGRASILVRLTALLFVLAVIGAECLVAFMWLPVGVASSATETSPSPPADGHATAATEKTHGKEVNEKTEKHGASAKTGHSKPTHAKPADGKAAEAHSGEMLGPDDQIEIDLEQYQITTQSASSSTTMRVEFHLYGVIKYSDKDEFEKLAKSCQHRLRDQVLFIIRSAQPRDLTDAGLGLIKRQILEKTNALLGKPLLRAVIVSDFSYLEQ